MSANPSGGRLDESFYSANALAGKRRADLTFASHAYAES